MMRFDVERSWEGFHLIPQLAPVDRSGHKYYIHWLWWYIKAGDAVDGIPLVIDMVVKAALCPSKIIRRLTNH